MWRERYLENVEQVKVLSSPYEEAYEAFELAARRAVANVAETIDPEYVAGLENRITGLEHKLESTIHQLNQSQKRAREMIEEQYMKTHAVQQLHDEILALNLQLNASEDKAKELQTENQELIARWVAKVDQDAAEAQ